MVGNGMTTMIVVHVHCTFPGLIKMTRFYFLFYLGPTDSH